MQIPEQPDSSVANRLCPACNTRLQRRPKENENAYAIRTFCNKQCYANSKRQAAKRAYKGLASR